MNVNPWLIGILLISLLILGLQSLPEHRPARVASPTQVTPADAPTAASATPAAATPAAPAEPAPAAHGLTVYRWQDAAGEWHVSNEPPPETSDYQIREYGR